MCHWRPQQRCKSIVSTHAYRVLVTEAPGKGTGKGFEERKRKRSAEMQEELNRDSLIVCPACYNMAPAKKRARARR